MSGPLRAGAAAAADSDPRAAARRAAREARDALDGAAQAGLVFATPEHADASPELLADVAGILGTHNLAGACVHGLVMPGLSSETGPAVGVAALGGIEARAFLLDDLAGNEQHAGEEIAALLPGGPSERDLVVTLPDPDVLGGGAFLEGLRRALGPASVVGVGAVEAAGGAALVWAGEAVAAGAVAGLVLRADSPPRVGVAQSCLPASDLLCVTRARGHWILELDGRPALEVFREVAREPLAVDLRRAARFVMAALPGDGRLEDGSYAVRNIVGFDAEEQAFAVADRLAVGDSLALAVREPEAARADLKRVVAALAEPGPALALYFDCLARGSALFGHDGLEAGYLAAGLDPAPVLGVMGSLEIGPVAGRPELLTYTGVLAVLDA
jgi:small ligand-binding sensory domain FIST